MGYSKKSNKEIKKMDDKTKKLGGGGASGHTTPAPPKRPFSEVANSSAEEIVLLSQHIEELSSEMKDSVSKMVIKDDMKLFIKTTVEEIMNEINIDSKSLNKNIEDLKKENELLRTENHTLQTKLKTVQNQIDAGEKRSQLAVKMAYYNEQYSRKNNIKILNIKEEEDETETSLMADVCKLFNENCAVDLNPRDI